MPVIVSTISPMRSERVASWPMASLTACDDSRSPTIAVLASPAASTPAVARSCVWPADCAVSPAAVFVPSTMCTWRPAPSATSTTAVAISSTARFTSFDVVAMPCDAEATVADASRTWVSSCVRLSRVAS